MFLKSLEMLGFKSFADKIRIEFADGITALLGPNGCGKSNVVDAIKWVLGEQSARSLRADTMEDIIFNGTETRKALSVAEVTLTISNENGRLPLEVPEIAIRRRLYRSGEAEYFINGAQVRLKEVRELFWDTGIGKSAYSVMEQGKIDQILSSKPEERRYLFEEAAGITKHKIRAREAEIKLGHTEENMRQVAGILGEVKRTHDTLKTQSEKTVTYRSLKDDIFTVELDLHLLRLRQFVQERDRRDVEIADATKSRDTLKTRMDSIQTSMKLNLDALDSLETTLVDVQKTIYGLAVERNGKDRQRKLFEDRVREARTKIDHARLRSKSVADRIEMLREDEDEKLAEIASIKSQLRDVEKNIHEFDQAIRGAEISVKSNDTSIRKAEGQIGSFEAERDDARIRLDAITEDIVNELDARLKESGYSAQERLSAEHAIESLIAAIRFRLSGRAALVGDLVRLKDASPSGVRAVAERTLEELTQTQALADELADRYRDYRNTTPSFIDEFLSPGGIITKKRAIDRELATCDVAIEEARASIASWRDENGRLGEDLGTYRSTLEELRGNRIRMQTRATAADENLGMLRRELAGQEAFLGEIENEIHGEERRLTMTLEELGTLDEEIADIETRGRLLTVELERLERDIASKNREIAGRRNDLEQMNVKLGELHTQLERLHLGRAQLDTEARNVRENFTEQYSRDLVEFEERMFEIRMPVSELRERLASLRQRLKDLGSVNLMAPEEFAEVRERYEFLSFQLADLEKARGDLRRITDEIRHESAELFLATYNKIRKNFHTMFRRLYGGGRGELRLVDPEHVLESGIEIFAQPPGKKLEVISLLSGGEKTLTAIALLFATYLVKPSPFCFLDEIDAALDEANVGRFVGLLREFGSSSQFVVITHNKKTVAAADTMLGVTMEESGVSKAVAIRIGRPAAPEAGAERGSPFGGGTSAAAEDDEPDTDSIAGEGIEAATGEES